VAYAFRKTLGNPSLRPTAIWCISSIFRNFFFSQSRHAFFPSRVPVSRVDHPLDRKIPFTPSWINVYMDFTPYWIRVLAFLLRNYGSRSLDATRDFISSIGKLYDFVGMVYRKNLSTTERPFYVARTKFFVIHLTDPHLMCIPSLHVMVVIHTYTKFAAILRSLNEAENRAAQIEEMRQGALAICQAILFVKQHSVNCIGASIYAMTRFDPELFPPEEAEAFCAKLLEGIPFAAVPWIGCLKVPLSHFSCEAEACKTCAFAVPRTKVPKEDIAEIKAYITDSYRRFSQEGKTAKSWEEPILNFLRQSPQVR